MAHHFIAGWSNLVARQAHNLKVVGSNPAPATKIFYFFIEFISYFYYNSKCNVTFAGVAQLAEHLTFNQVVGGSNPPWLTIYIFLARGRAVR